MKLRTILLLFGYFAFCLGNFNRDISISINGTEVNVEPQGGELNMQITRRII